MAYVIAERVSELRTLLASMHVRSIAFTPRRTKPRTPPKRCSTSIRSSALTVALASGLSRLGHLAVDDLPEKWKQFTERNAKYFGR